MRLNYPHAVNETCGLHVHVGLNRLNYSRLMERPFFDLFYQRMERFARSLGEEPGAGLLLDRLAGNNRYCRRNFVPERQVFMQEHYGEARYAALNFCYGRHGTLECRVFPCFPNVEHSISGMETFCDIVNTYLSQCAPEKPVTVLLTEKDIPQDQQPKPIHRKHVLDYRLNRA